MKTMLARSLPLVLGLVAFATTTFVGAEGVPLKTPLPGPSLGPGAFGEIRTISGRGAAEAQAVVASAPGLLPFRPLMPADVPTRYGLSLANVIVSGASSASFELLYVGADASDQLHVYQKAGPITKEPVAPIVERDIWNLANGTWRYMRIAFPQPSGVPLVLHVLERFDGERFVSIDVRSRGQLELEKAELAKVAISLR